jgi:peptidoglycan/xylan/chitin deacetylase (PgdA/CDA1 family)
VPATWSTCSTECGAARLGQHIGWEHPWSNAAVSTTITTTEMSRAENAVTLVTVKAPEDRHAHQVGLRGFRLGCIGMVVCMVIGSGFILSTSATASVTRPLTVSLTFDDGAADQMTAQQLLNKHGMVGTFYINSSFVGSQGVMTRTDLETLKANGHEIGGHSFNHPSLISISADEANRQICVDRNTLLSWGFPVTSFAYPFSDFNPSVESTVQACGYNTARAVGGLRSPHSCTECPAAEPFPPLDLYATFTPDDINTTWTLEDLKNTVTRAEVNGGWLAFNFHHICDACDSRSIRASVLDQFLAWLQPRSGPTIRTTVKSVQQVVPGSVKPPVAPIPPPPPGDPDLNTVRNASLETVSSVNPRLPDCFSNSAGYGTNKVTYTRVRDAHSGNFGERMAMTSRTDGDAKLVTAMDLGECSSQVASGRNYELSAWYKSNVEVFFTLYKRNASGEWSYWTQSPRFAPVSGWTRATWISVPPADAVAVSFGLTMDSVGTMTIDDYGFADTEASSLPRRPESTTSGTR